MKQILTLFLIALWVSSCSTPSPLRPSVKNIDYRNHVSLSWENIDNAEGFEIKREGKLIGITGPNDTGYTDINTDGGLFCENTYTYTVTPIGAGMDSATIPVTTGICPPKNRIALVIGNSHYERNKDLDNPYNDVSAMAERLEQLGFKVLFLHDGTHEEMQNAIKGFGQNLYDSNGADFGFFYYSGHGQRNGANYLLPVNDYNLDDSTLSDDNAVSDNFLLKQMDDYNKKGINIAVLDACRDNSIGSKGFKRPGLTPHFGDYQSSVVVGFADEPGATIPNRHSSRYSLYTEKLLEALGNSSHKLLTEMFNEVEEKVNKASDGRQKPETIYGSLGDICLGTCQ
jgi:hypothetical protein